MRRVSGVSIAFVSAVVGVAVFGVIPAAALRPAFAQQRQQQQAPAGLKFYPSPYYNVYSDLSEERVNEALLRMTRMAEEYHERTKEFSGVIREKFPFYLFKDAADYYQAGGLPGSAGVFMVRGNEAKLMAIAGEDTSRFTWHVVQHEGFHQFAHAVIGGDLPVWANEGLAEYFGEGLFTGDAFVTGVMPPSRVKRIQDQIKNKKFKSIQRMMLLSHEQWNNEMAGTNYDMAWSMVHFLAHGEEGKYTGAFASFIKDIGRRRPWDKAWEANFGSADGFEKKWGEWWLAQDPGMATLDLYAKATVATLTSYVGRAGTAKQTFDDLDEFLKAAKEGSVKTPTGDWLPPGLLTATADLLERLRKGGEVKFELSKNVAPKGPGFAAVLKDETRITATYNARAKAGPARVTITIDDFPARLAQAKALLADKKKEQARTVLQNALKRSPQSPLAAEAKQVLQQTYAK